MTQFHEVPLDSTVRVRFEFTQSTGKMGSFKLYYLFNPAVGAPSNGNLAAFAQLCQSTWDSTISTHMHPTTVLKTVDCRDLSSDTAAVGVWTGSVPGKATGQALSPEITVLVHFLTQRAYRGGKPRINLPMGIATDLDADGEHWTSAAMTNFEASVNAFLSGIAGTTDLNEPIHVTASYYKGSQPNPNPSKWAPREVPAPRTDTDGTNEGIVNKIVTHTVRPTSGILRKRVATS